MSHPTIISFTYAYAMLVLILRADIRRKVRNVATSLISSYAMVPVSTVVWIAMSPKPCATQYAHKYSLHDEGYQTMTKDAPSDGARAVVVGDVAVSDASDTPLEAGEAGDATPVQASWPVVRVPVLSKATVLHLFKASSTFPPLINIPLHSPVTHEHHETVQ